MIEERNKPSDNAPSKSTSMFSSMDSAQRKQFHSADAQRARNEERKQAKKEGRVYDIALSWRPSDNAEGISTATNDTMGVDEFSLSNDAEDTPANASAGGTTLKGVLVYRAGETEPDFISIDEVFSGYSPNSDDDWSLEFSVTNRKLDAFTSSNPAGTDNADNFDGDASANPIEAQTFYSIPVVRAVGSEKYTFSIAGVYRENIFCAGSKGGIVELIKIG